jgi:uncharacterized protein (TIGR02145 family)
MKKLLISILLPFSLLAQEDLKTSTGSFDYQIDGDTYLYEGDYVISKESGKKEKLPHGKGKLMQPENMTPEKMEKKGYSLTPYFYEGEWKLGAKEGVGVEKKFKVENGNAILIQHYQGSFKNNVFDGKGTEKTTTYEFIGDFEKGKKNGVGNIMILKRPTQPSEGRIQQVGVSESYIGNFLDDMFHGMGTYEDKVNNERFEGEFAHNKFKKGKYFYKSGDTYDGEWNDGVPNGIGVYVWKKTNETYEGEFSNGEPKGKGKITKKDGSIFSGVINNGEITGDAMIKSFVSRFDKNNVLGVYEGQVVNSKPHGTGTFTSSKTISHTTYQDNGDEIKKQVPEYSYIGLWEKGQKAGQGNLKVYLSDDYGVTVKIYEGGFKEDLFDGDNCKQNDEYESGFVNYDGSYKAGKYHGRGILESSGDGTYYIYEGEFQAGKFHGNGVFKQESGMGFNVKKGTFQDDEIIQGSNELFTDSESKKPLYIYNGSFKNGVANGKGKIEYFAKLEEFLEDWSENKVKTYDGEWANDQPNGQGVMVYKNGKTETGRFRNGQTLKAFNAPNVKIGNQTWMSENLTVTTFRNGDPIPEAKTIKEWIEASQNGNPAFCYYNNDPSTAKTQGVLYNWYAVNDPRGLAPEGWKVPSHTDVKELSLFIDKEKTKEWEVIAEKQKQGINTSLLEKEFNKKYATHEKGNPNIGVNKLKTTSSTDWSGYPGTNTYGFNAKINPVRWDDGSFSLHVPIDYGSHFWTTSFNTNESWNAVEWKIRKIHGSIEIDHLTNKGCGLPIRLLKIN